MINSWLAKPMDKEISSETRTHAGEADAQTKTAIKGEYKLQI